jgi:hypothetical protein
MEKAANITEPLPAPQRRYGPILWLDWEAPLAMAMLALFAMPAAEM